MTLTLKQMQDMGMSAFFSDKEVEEQIQQALDNQKLALDFLSLKTKQSKIEQHSLDYILTNGGRTKHTFEGVKYSISVLTYQDLNLIDNSIYKFCWIIDFPMYELNSENNKIEFSHNPFSMPQGGIASLNSLNPLEIKAFQYDIVCNGVELCSGAIRNHKPEIMYRAFEIAGYGSLS